MRLTDRLRNLAATFATNLRARHNAAVAYAHTLPTRAKIAHARRTSRLGDALVDVAAKLHEATTEAKRQQWRRRIQAWRQSVRIEELMLGDAKTSSGGRVVVTGKGDAKAAHFVGNRAFEGFDQFNQDFQELLTKRSTDTRVEATQLDAAAIVAKLGKAN